MTDAQLRQQLRTIRLALQSRASLRLYDAHVASMEGDLVAFSWVAAQAKQAIAKARK